MSQHLCLAAWIKVGKKSLHSLELPPVCLSISVTVKAFMHLSIQTHLLSSFVLSFVSLNVFKMCKWKNNKCIFSHIYAQLEKYRAGVRHLWMHKGNECVGKKKKKRWQHVLMEVWMIQNYIFQVRWGYLQCGSAWLVHRSSSPPARLANWHRV